MDTYYIIAQLIGIVAMFFNVISYQSKSYKGVIGLQMCGGLLFCINFFMLGAPLGGCLNFLAVIRAIVYLKRETFRTDKVIWACGFGVVFVIMYVLTFTVFGTPLTFFNLILELLPVFAMIFSTFIMRLHDASKIRKYGFFISAPWLIYNIVNLAIGAIICECLNLGSIFIGILRLDRKKK